METEKTQVSTDTLSPGLSATPCSKAESPKHSPKSTSPPLPVGPQPLGVLHLGKVSRETCMEVEAIRIVVPRAAISRSSRIAKAKVDAGQQVEERSSSPQPSVDDWRGQLEKLQNSERRLLQDKEGLSNQLRVQTEASPT